MFFNNFKFYFIIIIVFIIIICVFTPILVYYPNLSYIHYPNSVTSSAISSFGFFWPTPDSTKISSFFGYRSSPTFGASSYHKGIDIAAPAGTAIFSVMSGTVINVGFLSSAGCCIIIKSNNFTISYCHIDPNFKVFIGQSIQQGQYIR